MKTAVEIAPASGDEGQELMTLKNPLRYLEGEELITRLGREYYD